MTSKPIQRRVGSFILRKMFNDGHYYERTKSGNLREDVKSQGHPSPLKSGHPICTYSQFVVYFDDETNQEVARVHQYKLPNGSIGGALGRPDPKRLIIDGIIYIP